MLNNKQLTNAIDSLQLIYIEKEVSFQDDISDKYRNQLIIDGKLKSIIYSNNKKQQYDIAISKVRTLGSIARANKNNLEYKSIIIAKHKIEWHRKISLAEIGRASCRERV